MRKSLVLRRFCSACFRLFPRVGCRFRRKGCRLGVAEEAYFPGVVFAGESVAAVGVAAPSDSIRAAAPFARTAVSSGVM